MALADQVRASSVPNRFVLIALKQAAENAHIRFSAFSKQLLLKLIPSMGAVTSDLIACCYCDLFVATSNAINSADTALETNDLSESIAAAFPSVGDLGPKE